VNAHLKLVKPRHVFRSVPIRPANGELRTREYLTAKEVDQLIKAPRDSRYGPRDATLILIAFRHGLRACEICDLEWSQIEFGRSASLYVRRAKNGKPSVHPLRGDEIRALREIRRQFPESGYVFATGGAGPSPRTLLTGTSNALANALASISRFTLTCSDTPAATRWRTPGTIPGRSRTGSGTARSSTPSVIPSYRRRASAISGGEHWLRPVCPQFEVPQKDKCGTRRTGPRTELTPARVACPDPRHAPTPGGSASRYNLGVPFYRLRDSGPRAALFLMRNQLVHIRPGALRRSRPG
jgi:Phage integrase family